MSVPDRGRIEAALGREHFGVRRRRRELQVVPGLFFCIPRPHVSKAFPGRRASLTVVADDELALVVDEAGHQVARSEQPASQDTLAADTLPAAVGEAPHLAGPPHPAYRMASDRGVQRVAEGTEVVHPHDGMVRLPTAGDPVAGHPGPGLAGQPIDGAVTVDVRGRVEAFDRIPRLVPIPLEAAEMPLQPYVQVAAVPAEGVDVIVVLRHPVSRPAETANLLPAPIIEAPELGPPLSVLDASVEAGAGSVGQEGVDPHGAGP